MKVHVHLHNIADVDRYIGPSQDPIFAIARSRFGMTAAEVQAAMADPARRQALARRLGEGRSVTTGNPWLRRPMVLDQPASTSPADLAAYGTQKARERVGRNQLIESLRARGLTTSQQGQVMATYNAETARLDKLLMAQHEKPRNRGLFD